MLQWKEAELQIHKLMYWHTLWVLHQPSPYIQNLYQVYGSGETHGFYQINFLVCFAKFRRVTRGDVYTLQQVQVKFTCVAFSVGKKA